MTPRESFEEIKKRIPPGSALTHALTEFVNFYAATSIEGCPKEADGDMLLFEWGGPYSWDESVSVSLTRQFSFNDEDGEYDHMQQLHMRCRYDASEVTLVAGNEWLHGQDTDSFLEYVLRAASTETVKNLSMRSIDFDMHDV
jgi:hypothetical protein